MPRRAVGVSYHKSQPNYKDLLELILPFACHRDPSSIEVVPYVRGCSASSNMTRGDVETGATLNGQERGTRSSRRNAVNDMGAFGKQHLNDLVVVSARLPLYPQLREPRGKWTLRPREFCNVTLVQWR